MSSSSMTVEKHVDEGQENVTPKDFKSPVPATKEDKFKLPPLKATPAAIRTRQLRKVVAVGSPSDACMSPCSQKLLGKHITSDNVHHPAMLRPKRLQHLSSSSFGGEKTPSVAKK